MRPQRTSNSYLAGVLAFGPIASIAAGSLAFGSIEASAFATAMILLWSPLPFSIPAMLLQGRRDAALTGVSAGLRAAMLIPHMVIELKDREMAISLCGWAAAIPLALSM